MAELTPHERDVLRWAGLPGLTPGEKRELLYFLDVETLPDGREARTLAVVEKLLAHRTAKPELPTRVQSAAQTLRYDMTQEHGGDHIVDAAELGVLLGWVEGTEADDGA